VSAWSATALWFQAPGSTRARLVLVGLWLLVSLLALIGLWWGHAPAALLAFGIAYAAVLVWWRTLKPSNQRQWSDDVAQISHGTLQGEAVTLYNVRNFRWRSNSDYTQAWETRHYDLGKLRTVDMITSYWSSRAIAHLLFSFGFTDGEHVVFSVEIRRERGEAYNEIGGFFKEFELSIIATDERDVIRVRTNVRGEDDYLYRLRMPVSAMRSLFLGYIEEANSLVRKPRFYNTITVNCTTLVYHMMKRIVGYLPLDYRLILAGYMPEYVHRVGGLDQRHSFETLRALGRITDRAMKADRSAAFSADIRRGIPELSSTDLPPDSSSPQADRPVSRF
jgi:hypothetical protein